MRLCITLLCNMSDMPLPDPDQMVTKTVLHASRCKCDALHQASICTTICALQDCSSTSQAHVQSSHAGYAPSHGFCQCTSHLMAVQASKVSRDGMLANIHFFRVRDYTEQASMVLHNTPCYMLIHDMLPVLVRWQMLACCCCSLLLAKLSTFQQDAWLTVQCALQLAVTQLLPSFIASHPEVSLVL